MSAHGAPRQSEDEPTRWILAIADAEDRHSFVCLFSSYGPKVKAYLIHRGVAAQTAEEIAQETFLAVWRKADQFDPARASGGAWIYAIARNHWLDTLRRERRATFGEVDEPSPAQTTPEESLTSTEREGTLRGAIDQLPSEQATVLRLAYYEDKTHVEIAACLGIPLGTVKSRIRLASAQLKTRLELSSDSGSHGSHL